MSRMGPAMIANNLTGLAGLVPVIVFLIVALAIAVYSRQRAAKGAQGGFVGEYFLGNRSLGAGFFRSWNHATLRA